MSIFDVFKKGLQKTAVAIGRGISSIFTSVKKWDDEDFKKLENELLAADFGVSASRKIVNSIRERRTMPLLLPPSLPLQSAIRFFGSIMTTCARRSLPMLLLVLHIHSGLHLT